MPTRRPTLIALTLCAVAATSCVKKDNTETKALRLELQETRAEMKRLTEALAPLLALTNSKVAADKFPAAKPETDVRRLSDEANRFYDRADYEAARNVARKVLETVPDHTRMLRVVVSASCIMGDVPSEYALLPERDKMQMQRRCSRYGIALGDASPSSLPNNAGVVRIDDSHFELSKESLDTTLTFTAMTQGARLVPSIKSGKANGLKLYAIRPNSWYASLGLMNGDTVHSINGQELQKAKDMIVFYTSLQNLDAFSIEVTRRRNPMTIHYKVK